MRQHPRHLKEKRAMSASPEKYPQGFFKNKPCRYCKTEFAPIAPSHLYCSEVCAATGVAENRYQRHYGISVKEVEEMLAKQNHVCAICQTEGFKMHEGVYYTLVVDHCHTNGSVRGALCNNCNRALGLFKDSIANLKSAIDYLEGATTISKESTLK